MKIYIEKSGKTVCYKQSFRSSLDLLKKLDISKDSIIIVRNGTVVLPEEPLDKNDEIRLLSVVSGG